MNAQQLKNSILQRALEGRLVPQRPEDGSAKELLEKIQEEKKQLIAEKKIKNAKPLPPISEDEIPFDIPDEWEWVRLQWITSIIGDGIHGTPEYDINGDIYFINGNNLCDGKIAIKGDTKKVSIKEAEKHRVDLNNNTVLVSINGTLGNVAFYSDEPVILGKSACYCNLLDGIDKEYIKLLIESSYYLTYALSTATGTTIKNVSLKAMRNFPVPLPPSCEQKRIVAKLKELLPFISQYDKAYTKLTIFNERFPEMMKKSILQYAIEGKLVEQRKEEGTADELLQQIQAEKKRLIEEKKIKKAKPLPPITEDEIPFDIPDTWKWVRLGEIGLTNIGLTYKPTDVTTNEGIIVLRSSNIKNDRIVYDDIVRVKTDIPKNKMCNVGDILICARNGSKRLVGKSAIIEREGMSFGAFMAIFKSLVVDKKYVLNVINSAYFRNSLLNETGTTTINQITQNMLKNFVLPLPPLAEQHRIVAKIEELLPLCERLIK